MPRRLYQQANHLYFPEERAARRAACLAWRGVAGCRVAWRGVTTSRGIESSSTIVFPHILLETPARTRTVPLLTFSILD